MPSNSDESEGLIERFMAQNRTSHEVSTNNSEEWHHDLAVMRDHAEKIIQTELLEYCPPGRIITCDFMDRHILKTFLASHAWRPSLEVRLKGGNLRWVNGVAWARDEFRQ